MDKGFLWNLTRDSLAIEIFGHVYLDKVADMAGFLNIKGIQAMSAEIKGRMDVIDCGERGIGGDAAREKNGVNLGD